MSADTEQRKLAAIMFTDMVGYSALSQRDNKLALELLEEHRDLLRRVFPEFKGTEIKTIGDAFLVEFNSALEAAQCAIEIQRTLAKRNADAPTERQIQVRIGIHIGDVLHRAGDVYGDGINIASRIEQLANPGGICVSMDVERQIRNALEARFEKLAPTELKNISVTMDLFRIVLPWERPGTPVAKTQARPKSTSRKFVPTAIALVLLLVVGVGWWWTAQPTRHPASPATPSTTSAGPEKSIAVLPFENLSDDKANAYFADGIQDEILTRLSKIADLKVISRTSTQHYKSAPENLPEIAKQLGVAHILEGRVQKSGDAVRVNVQLIKAVNDSHLWADTFDRKLTDIFAVESEVAKAIADQLRAKLTGQEEQVIAAKPTNNPAAYDAYLRGRAFGSSVDKSIAERAIQSYQEAVKLDPNFALAWAYLSCAQSGSYWLGFDASLAGLAAAKDAADRVLALDPNLPEAHLALGYYRYYGQRDYTGALAEFQQAERGLPNYVDVIGAIGLIQRRLGHWDEAIVALRRAVELDPRNINAYINLASIYNALRRFPEALATADRALAVEPVNAQALGLKADAFWATGDLEAVEPLLTNPGTEPLLWGGSTVPVRGVQALFQRRYAAAIEIFSSAVAAKTKRGQRIYSEKLLLALSQQRAGDGAAARGTYQETVQDMQRALETVASDSYQAAGTHAVLGQAYAGLGEVASAIGEGQKAVTLLPSSKDLFDGPLVERDMAQIYALLGDADQAIPILKRLLQTPYALAITPALLRLDPIWDQIRNDPRFQKLAESANPK